MKKRFFYFLAFVVGLFFFLMGIDYNFDFNNQNLEAKGESENVELLATSATKFSNFNKNRCTNILLAADSINGIVLNTSEIFSFNEVVGERTEEKGYKSAPTFLKNNGKVEVVDDIGGGICQVSSTLYMAAKEAWLQIIERNPHSKRVSYCKKDEEAMVSYDSSDLKFSNKFNYNVKIEFVIIECKNYSILKCNIYALSNL